MATKVIKTTPEYVGERMTLAVETDLVAPYRYHWMKNGVIIGGAPSDKTYTTPPLRPEDIGADYQVKVWGQGSFEMSGEPEVVPEPEEEKP